MKNKAPNEVDLYCNNYGRLDLPPWPVNEFGFYDYENVNTYIRRDFISEYISKRLKELWKSSSAMDDHDEYYKNPVVQELKNLNKLIHEDVSKQ